MPGVVLFDGTVTFQEGVVPLIFGKAVVVKFQFGEVVTFQKLVVVQLLPGLVLFDGTVAFHDGVVKFHDGVVVTFHKLVVDTFQDGVV